MHLSTVIAFSHCRAHACKSPEMARFWEVSQRVFHKLLGGIYSTQKSPEMARFPEGSQKVPQSIPQAFG